MERSSLAARSSSTTLSLLVRLNPNGCLTTSSGTAARSGPMGTSVAPAGAAAIAIQPDGKIVAAGYSFDASAIARFHPDGHSTTILVTTAKSYLTLARQPRKL